MPGILRTLSLWFLSGKSKRITREPLMKGYNDAKRVAILFEMNSPDEIIKAGEIENILIGQSKEVFKVFYIARKKFTGLIE
ncbi:MAG TPA: hypothetical protein VLH16_03255, partial [Bacteroidales bacterium]|nr:hypothetical protein [Bacteroidales bacterium]